VGDDEITNIVHHIRDVNGEPEFDERFQRNIDSPDEAEGEASGEYDDDLVPAAIDIIRTSKRASTSFLQRKLKIGYNRAARIMEILEDEGIVGPENGSSPREILIDQDF
jgi:S-DNA-T family DNA segregation ATPase FtsK/SpoIIIE